MENETMESLEKKLAEAAEALRRCRIDAPEYEALYRRKRQIEYAIRKTRPGNAWEENFLRTSLW